MGLSNVYTDHRKVLSIVYTGNTGEIFLFVYHLVVRFSTNKLSKRCSTEGTMLSYSTKSYHRLIKIT